MAVHRRLPSWGSRSRTSAHRHERAVGTGSRLASACVIAGVSHAHRRAPTGGARPAAAGGRCVSSCPVARRSSMSLCRSTSPRPTLIALAAWSSLRLCLCFRWRRWSLTCPSWPVVSQSARPRDGEGARPPIGRPCRRRRPREPGGTIAVRTVTPCASSSLLKLSWRRAHESQEQLAEATKRRRASS